MPTYLGTVHYFKYDLGEAMKRGVTKKFSGMKRSLRAVLGKGAFGLKKEYLEGRVIASFELIFSDHILMQKDSRTHSPVKSCTRIEELKAIPEYIESQKRDIIHWT